MKTCFFIILFIVSFMAIAQTEVKNKPAWVDTPPVSNDLIYGVGVADSKDLVMASQKADINANKSVSDGIREYVLSLCQKSDAAHSGDEQYIKSIRKIRSNMSSSYTGVETKESNYLKVDGKIEVYVLRQISKSTIHKTFMEKVNADTDLKEKLVKAGLFDEMKQRK